MARYINLDEAVQRIVDLKLKNARNNIVLAADEEEVKDWLQSMPAMDVQEVRHGRWIHRFNDCYECSVCEEMIDNYDDPYEFCPRCGARMDEVEE